MHKVQYIKSCSSARTIKTQTTRSGNMQNPQKQGPPKLKLQKYPQTEKKLRPIKIKNPKNMKPQNTREILNL